MLGISRSIRSIHLFSFSLHSQTLRSNGKRYRSERACVLYVSQTWIQSLPSVKEKGNQEVNKLIRSSHFPIGSDFCVAIEISFFFFCLPFCLKSLCNRKPKEEVHLYPSVTYFTHTHMHVLTVGNRHKQILHSDYTMLR